MCIYPKVGTNEAAQEHQCKYNIGRFGSFGDQKLTDTVLVLILAGYIRFTILPILDHYCEVEIVNAVGTYIEDWGQLRTCFFEVDEADEAVSGDDHEEGANLSEYYKHSP